MMDAAALGFRMMVVGAASMVLATLSGCSDGVMDEGAEPAAASDASMMDEHGAEGHHDDGFAALPVEKRLAFMRGHYEAGVSLYRAGEPEMAAPHLLHPVSEAYEAEREGLDALGFQPALFEAVSQALADGQPAELIEPQLAAAGANLDAMEAEAGGEPADLIRYLMCLVELEYAVGVTDGQVTDPGEYQDAFGFTVVAQGHAMNLPDPQRETVGTALSELLALWPAAPIPPENPASPEAIGEAVDVVRILLEGMDVCESSEAD